jgi:hypothetical protein
MRFLSPDPLAEKYYSVSLYVYCGNNPVRYVDPTGMEWETKDDEEYAKLLAQEMANRINSEQKNLYKLNAQIAQKQAKGKDVSKDQAKAAGIESNIDNLKAGISELTAMGETKDQLFTYSKIDGNVGHTNLGQDGVIVMNISGSGNISNGIHESSHGYDLWKSGRPTERNAVQGEVKAYSRQFSYDKYSLPISDFGRAKSLNDINPRWVLGITSGGEYIYIQFIYPNRNPEDVLQSIKNIK